MKKVKEQSEETTTPSSTPNQDEENPDTEAPANTKLLMLKVPYAGEKGESLVKGLTNCLQRNLPDNIKCRVVQTGTKISQSFNVKDRLDGKHLSNFI